MVRTLGASIALVCAGTACAQVVGVTIEIDEPVLALGDSTTVRLVASFPDSDYAIAGVLMSLRFDTAIAEPRSHWSDLDYLPPFDGPGPPPGSIGDEAISLINAGQLNFPQAMIYAYPTNPIAFWEATFTASVDAGGGYRVDLLTDVSRFDCYPLRGSGRSESRLDMLVEGEASIFVVPARRKRSDTRARHGHPSPTPLNHTGGFRHAQDHHPRLARCGDHSRSPNGQLELRCYRSRTVGPG